MDTGTIDRQQNNIVIHDDDHDSGTPPPEYTQEMERDQAIPSEQPDLEESQTVADEAPMENSGEQTLPPIVEPTMSNTVTRYHQPQLVEHQRLSGSAESTQSGTVIRNASSPEITDLEPQQYATVTPEHEESSPWIRVLRLVWPNGAQQRRKRLVFVGKFEIILGMYFLIFGVASVIVTNQIYNRYFIPVYGAVAGYGVLLLITGSFKACTIPSESNVTSNTVLSFICCLGGGGVAVWCLFNLLNIPTPYTDKFEYPYMLAVAAGTAAATGFLSLIHVGCYAKGKNIPLERVQIIVSTNTKTGERFIETVQPQPEYQEPSESRQDFHEQSYPGSSQDTVHYNQQGILMSNIGRSTSMRTIQNQYVERTNHELPQQFHTVHRHPVTMAQHRQQETRYATSEFNSMHPMSEKPPFDQIEFVNRHVHSDFDSPRAMTEVNYPSPRTIVGHQYAQSEIGQPRAMTEIDYPQPQTISRQQYAQSEAGHSRAMTEVDYPQSRIMLPEQYAHSDIGQQRTVTQGGYAQPQTLQTQQFAQGEVGHPRAITNIEYTQPQTIPRQYYAEPERGNPSTMPGSLPGQTYQRPEVPRPYPPNVQTPSRQYTRSELSQPATLAGYPQRIPEVNYAVNTPEMQGQMHPEAGMGFRTVPSHALPYQTAPSEAGYSYAPSESGYPPNQTGRISPRRALAERQMRMEAARQESLMRRQPPVRNGSQQYMVPMRQYR